MVRLSLIPNTGQKIIICYRLRRSFPQSFDVPALLITLVSVIGLLYSFLHTALNQPHLLNSCVHSGRTSHRYYPFACKNSKYLEQKVDPLQVRKNTYFLCPPTHGDSGHYLSSRHSVLSIFCAQYMSQIAYT